MSVPWIRSKDDVLTLSVHVQPNAKRSEVVGVHGAALKVKVASPPVDGAANEALLEFLAGVLGLRRASIVLVRGATGRQKAIEIRGLGVDEATALLMPGGTDTR